MTLFNVIKNLKRIALGQHNVRYAGDGDLYRDLNANPSIKYDVFYITQNEHHTEGDMDRYSFNLFYISRIEDADGSNETQIQSIGKEVLWNVIKTFCEDYDADIYGNVYWQPFTQRFSDLCAGMYAVITLEVSMESSCIDE